MDTRFIKTITLLIFVSILFLAGCEKKPENTPGKQGQAGKGKTVVTDEIPGIPNLTEKKTDKPLPKYEVKVLGGAEFMAGSTGAFRIITYNPSTQNPVPGIPVSIYLTKQGEGKDDPKRTDEFRKKLVFSQLTGENGSLDAQFPIPEDFEGTYRVDIVTGVPGNHTSADTSVVVAKKIRIYLTIDKPMYQPGQKINIRALVLGLPRLAPEGEKEITLEVMDGKGNKVYKNKEKTSKYGVASAVFQLADEVNMGTFKVKAVMGKVETSRDFEVKKYVLPKFKVSFTPDRKFYAPGDTISGDVQADYFFGKPVAKSKVSAVLHTFDTAMRPIARSQGSTDNSGHFKFKMKIPSGLVGSPLDKGGLKALMEVVVTDTAEHTERTYKSIPVSKESLAVELFPESGKIKPGIENKIFIMTSYPDGSPVAATVNLAMGQVKKSVVTDNAGLSTVMLKPDESMVTEQVSDLNLPVGSDPTIVRRAIRDDMEIPAPSAPAIPDRLRRPSVYYRPVVRVKGVKVDIDAYTPNGDKLKKAAFLETTGAKDNIIIRPSKASYTVGDTLNFEILTDKGNGSCYIDFVKDNQAISTHAVTLSGSSQAFSTEATPDMAGMLTVHAYMLTSDNNIIRDTKNIFIKSADELSIKTSLDKSEYKPGEDAKISFSITDKSGSPVAAAMGIDIVDEALFAMGQMRPGLEKAYFMLQKEFMTPKYEVRGRLVRDIALQDDKIGEDLQLVDQVLLTKVPVQEKFAVNLDTRSAKIEECFKKMQAIVVAISVYHSEHKKYPGSGDMDILNRDYLSNEDFIKKNLDMRYLKHYEDYTTDPWGNKFWLKDAPSNGFPQIMTNGPDGKKDTSDDMDMGQIQGEYWRLFPENRPVPPMPSMELRTDGPVRGSVPTISRRIMMDASSNNEASAPRMIQEKKKEQPPAAETAASEPPLKIREYFPETLYTNPQVITDDKGNASIEVKMADSITSWRMAAFANSLSGKMGNAVSAIKVFQDFFTDIDFPVALTQGDEVSVPIAVYNYLKEEQEVKLTVDKSEKWFELLDKDEKTVNMKPDEVKAVFFRIKVKDIGNRTFTVQAKGSKLSDAIRRQVEVLPNGRLFTWTKSDSLSQKETVDVNIPEKALPGASKILVRLYPGVMSQVVDGLDKVFRMPYGCFEQTTSITYPNVMVLDYLKRQKKTTPELQMKAESYVNTGYQRLLSFEVPGGGFSYYGKNPADPAITAMGIMEFRDMSKVHDVDENVIKRSQDKLISMQSQDGSWNGDMRFTAYIVWALSESGYDGPGFEKGLQYVRSKIGQQNDPYILALAACALSKKNPDDKLAGEILEKLRGMAKQNDKAVCWGTNQPTITHSYGNYANIEVTALAAMAMMRVHGYEDMASKAITYLVQMKDPHGTWYSTQATVLTLKALILAHEKSTQDVDAKVKITVNGKQTEEFRVNSANFDVFNQADFKNVTVNGKNKVEISLAGKGSCYYQVVAEYYMPWVKKSPAKDPLTINIDYNRTTLSQNDTITATVYVRNNTREPMHNVMIDLGIPPGFSVETGELDRAVNNVFAKYTLTDRQILVYTDVVKPGQTLKFRYGLRSRYPLKAKTPESNAYLYYAPEVKDVTEPVVLTVK